LGFIIPLLVDDLISHLKNFSFLIKFTLLE